MKPGPHNAITDVPGISVGNAEDQQVRWSLLWEYTPIEFLQSRIGARLYDGVPQANSQNRSEFFWELHGFF